MITSRCHACHGVTLVDATRCEACAAALDAAVGPPWASGAFDPRASSGAIWFDDLTPLPAQPDAESGPATVPGALSESLITLRELEAGAPAHELSRAVTVVPRAGVPAVCADEPRARLAGAATTASMPAPASTAQARHRAERRAAVRKSRVHGKPAAGGGTTISEVLVFDAHDADRDRLCSLLRDFGFWVRSASRADEAAALAASHTFVAAFVNIALDAADGGAGIELCQQIRAAGRRHGSGAGTLLVLATTRLQPMDRVRAELAGCEEIIAKPVTRGSVAAVLDSRGIALPADRRQG